MQSPARRFRFSGGQLLLDLGFGSGAIGLARPARTHRGAAGVRVPHPRKQPFPRSRDVDQDPITDPGIWQPVRFIEPTADGAVMAINFCSEGFEIEVIGEKIVFGHFGPASHDE